MKENLKPGPKVPGRLAKTGEYCPPSSEGARLYRGIRSFRKVCKYGGHPKFHPGRCVECRRLSDKRRAMKPDRAARKLEASRRWHQDPQNKPKIAAWSKRRNARQEQKDAAAHRGRLYRRGERVNMPKDPKAIAAKLLAKATVKAAQAKYGIRQVGNYNP